MLTEEKREKMRMLCTRLGKRPSINATLEMLDMIDKLEAVLIEVKVENLKWNDVDCNTCLINTWEECDEICASKGLMINELACMRKDRDRWKARAEALERAAREFELADGIFSFACFCCVYKSGMDTHKCELLGDDVCENLENWQFDEDRFAGGKEGA